MSYEVDRSRSLEELDGEKWPEPGPGSTSLVSAIDRLRRRPIGELTAYDLSRLIGQDIGLRWLIPVSLEILRETAPDQAAGGFYDDDLLTAVLSRGPDLWETHPEWAREVKEILSMLGALSVYVQREADDFLARCPEKS
ncbi:hypothetical protein H9Y04_06060 [Streptomyces sp. TRM66268-LWL]|uniref:Uncharacterized protein n=1 Tax=Streptomyces polyasparticus TaxID=2767826 RepID=A0ABR7SCS4_9ACTN|nr:contact-dependent growth inhibition system immunity protein [Streptomyces polyasparticus]MBC9712133.1 hypothetical protein [Streptomyces polyasparticus]